MRVAISREGCGNAIERLCCDFVLVIVLSYELGTSTICATVCRTITGQIRPDPSVRMFHLRISLPIGGAVDARCAVHDFYAV